jgi:protoporphyrinogen/coproporphyrinogen III oxidase
VSDPGVIIIGGGISGLAAAYFLGRAGLRSLLIEKSGRVGGVIRTDSVQGCVLEAGPDSYLAAKPAATELARELPGLSDQIIDSNDAARRIFVVQDGKFVPFPRGMVMMAPAEWTPALTSPLFNAGTKLRFLAETLSRPRTRADDVSVGDFVRDHFGSEVLELIAEPLLAGVYGGDSSTLSALSVLPRFVAYEQKYGSLIRGVRQERRDATHTGSLFRSFRDGMQTLTDTLAAAAAPHTTILYGEATRVERAARWRVQVNGEWMTASYLVLACPAHVTARLLETAVPDAASELASIAYSSAILATFVYDRRDLNRPLDGFGFLVPRRERRTIAAATWVSTKFPSRTPAQLAAIRAFVVAEQATELLHAPPQTVAELARSDLAKFMGLEAQPRFSKLHSWPDSMPQYVVGHEQRRQRIAAALENAPGLSLTGNVLEGVGIPDCVRSAKQTAKRIVENSTTPFDS